MTWRSFSKWYWMGLFACVFALSQSWAYANHPFHVCVGQMQWNPISKHWEVSLRMHPRDLEEVLSNQKKKSISVEDAEFQEIACDYLANQFFLLREPEGTANSTIIDRVEKLPELRSAEQTISSPQPNSLQDAVPVQQRSELQWVGLEHERGWLWIHLELIPPKDEPGTVLYLVHRIFLNQIDRQENSVQILFSRTQRSSLQFKRQSPVRLFDTSAPQ